MVITTKQIRTPSSASTVFLGRRIVLHSDAVGNVTRLIWLKCCHTYLFYYMCCYLKVKPMRRCVNGPPTQETFQDPDDLLPRRLFWRRRCVNGPPTQETSQDPDDLLPRKLFEQEMCQWTSYPRGIPTSGPPTPTPNTFLGHTTTHILRRTENTIY